jgi:hypothetical protein
VPPFRQKLARSYLRVAYTLDKGGASPSRVSLLLTAIAVFFRVAWVNLVAVAGTVAALFPLLGRRRPVGTRSSRLRDRGAPVIPLEARRRAQGR